MAVRAELKNAQKNGDAQHYVDTIRRYPTEYKLVSAINKLETSRRKLSQQIKKIRESKTIPEEQKKAMIDLLKQRQEEIVGRANQLFREE